MTATQLLYTLRARIALSLALKRHVADPGRLRGTIQNEPLMVLYTLLVLVVGEDCDRGHVHDAWALAKQTVSPGHPDLVPPAALLPEVQATDDPYVEAIREAARSLKEAGA